MVCGLLTDGKIPCYIIALTVWTLTWKEIELVQSGVHIIALPLSVWPLTWNEIEYVQSGVP